MITEGERMKLELEVKNVRGWKGRCINWSEILPIDQIEGYGEGRVVR